MNPKKVDRRVTDTREKLILAGLEEINKYGINDFSARRVAKQCGISCSAPYKHFRDRDDFIEAIFLYLKNIYDERQKALLEEYKDASCREQLIRISMTYIDFLTEYPLFRRMIMQFYETVDEDLGILRGKLSDRSFDMVDKYCRQVDMPPDVRKRKQFIVRSIIFTAAMFFDNGELEYTEENRKLVESLISREFDLP
ncbi:MAG: TetR/AcrR family transcriptional regulator [Clostridia bacterium]|nr:TetR/AcrR family transcriptional regulator [Clostridia bacterium]